VNRHIGRYTATKYKYQESDLLNLTTLLVPNAKTGINEHICLLSVEIQTGVTLPN